jgi:GWxTD domain-containing protein
MRLEKILLMIAMAAGLAFPAQAAGMKPGMPEKYKKWLDEVSCLMTGTEKKVFKQLASDKDRDFFIGAFWKQRDPTPGTAENEFENEFYKRMREADEKFGHGSIPGWRTEMGRIYMILGPPQDIETKGEMELVYPMQLWHYVREPEGGLPSSFYLLFFKEEGVGDYVLYSPYRNGPNQLIQGHGNVMSEDAALSFLEKVDPLIRRVSLSLVEGEGGKLASESLVLNIENYPVRNVDPTYAENIVRYKDYVEMDYSFDYVKASGTVVSTLDSDGFYTVHYCLEPERFSFQQKGDHHEANIVVYGNVTDAAGRSIRQFERSLPLKITGEEFKDIGGRPFSFQDSFPMIEGKYRLNLLMKNTISKEFSSFDCELAVGSPGGGSQLGRMILGYDAKQTTPDTPQYRAFRIGNMQFYPTAGKQFIRGDSVYVLLECMNIGEDLRTQGKMEYRLLLNGKEVTKTEHKIAPSAQAGYLIEHIPTGELSAGVYDLEAVLKDGKGSAVEKVAERFPIIFGDANPHPWIVSYWDRKFGFSSRIRILGEECLRAGETEKGVDLLKEAGKMEPGSTSVAIDLSEGLLASGRYGEAAAVLEPLRENAESNPEMLFLLGRAYHGGGRYAEARDSLLAYLKHNSTNTSAINLLGECFIKTGQPGEALKAFETSLKLVPEQPEIAAKLEAMKRTR